jgi:hypothetical protein
MYFHAMPLGKQIHVMAEVGKQDMGTEMVKRHAGITRQPIGDDLVFGLHAISFVRRSEAFAARRRRRHAGTMPDRVFLS